MLFFWIFLYFGNLFKTSLVVTEYPRVPESAGDIIEMGWKSAFVAEDPVTACIFGSTNVDHIKLVQLAKENGNIFSAKQIAEVMDIANGGSRFQDTSIISAKYIVDAGKILFCNMELYIKIHTASDSIAAELHHFPLSKNISSQLEQQFNSE